jgi:hypothetical protein
VNTCEARIPIGQRPRLTVNHHGLPETVQDRCSQSVGLTSFLDASGQEHWYCRHPLHKEDVEAQALRADAIRFRDLELDRIERAHRARIEYEETAKWSQREVEA